MTTTNQHPTAFAEGQSVTRPPQFNGTDYTYWKTRMHIYIASQDYDLWDIIKRGYVKPKITVDHIEIEKPEDKWDVNDKKRYSLNAKAMNALYCALDKTEFNRVSVCDSAQEIWHKLEVTHEGTSQVKESKLAMLQSQYESFRVKKDETIAHMFTRFTDIVNTSKALGKEYPQAEQVRKILRCLPAQWDPKVTAIQEANSDLSKMQLETLVGNLTTHEMEMKLRQSAEDEEKAKPKEKTIALRARFRDEKNSDAKDTMMDTLLDEFGNFLKMRKGGNRSKYQNLSKDSSDNNDDSNNDFTCHHCRKTGHFRKDCPDLKRNKNKWKKKYKGKGAYKATWDNESELDSSSSSDESEVVALMARSSRDDDSESDDDNEVKMSYEELDDAYSLSCEQFDKCFAKLKESRTTIISLKKEKENLLKEKSDFEKQIDVLKRDAKGKKIDHCEKCDELQSQITELIKEVDKGKRDFNNRCITLVTENTALKARLYDLEVAVNKFSTGGKGLDLLLSNTRFSREKHGLGFNEYSYKHVNKSSRIKNKYFAMNRYENSSALVCCSLCKRFGHASANCLRKDFTPILKQIWMPKNSMTNPFGPTWIPRSQLTSFS